MIQKYKYILIFTLLSSLSLFLYIKYTNNINNAYNKGIIEERNRQKLIQIKVLEEMIKENKIKQDEAYNQGVESVKKEKEIQIVYKEKIKVVEKIVEVNPNLDKDLCKLPDEEFEKMKELLK